MMNKGTLGLFGIVLLLSLFFGCDPERKKKCEWFLEPEPELKGTVTKAGFIPVCARNFTNNKQYCRLQASMDFAKAVYGKKFKFVDMKIDSSGRFPKTVLDIKTCQ